MNAVRTISQVAGLMADPKRSAMLWALIDGSPRAADELALTMGLSLASACAHLSLLSSAGLLKLEIRRRKRYFRLATPQVGAAVEALASVQVNGHSPASRVAPTQVLCRCAGRACAVNIWEVRWLPTCSSAC